MTTKIDTQVSVEPVPKMASAEGTFLSELVGFTFGPRLEMVACIRCPDDPWHIIQLHPSRIRLV